LAVGVLFWKKHCKAYYYSPVFCAIDKQTWFADLESRLFLRLQGSATLAGKILDGLQRYARPLGKLLAGLQSCTGHVGKILELRQSYPAHFGNILADLKDCATLPGKT
jgi:hypothetical protein